ncbi:phage tail fiber protein [Aureimonas ureilytica]|uniref:phage tail fiber protein n=1 Tax=Aureimonas ureilytica TaxID=401562 RepID=UPI000733E39E|nr:hypothetical protein [Aureimonas ureilytica]
MSAMTNYLEKKLLDHVIGKTAYPMPNPVYLALFTADPGEAGSLTAEVSAGGYARQAITDKLSQADASAGTTSNTGAVTFGPASADWGTITHVGVMDAANGGNMLLYGALAVSKVINSGDSLQYAVGQLTITFA